MELDDYLVEGETPRVSGPASESINATSSHNKGTIACTGNRVVFTKSDGVVDISLHSVGAIEYELPSYPLEYILWSGGFFVLSVLSFLIGPAVLPDRVPTGMVTFVCAITGGFILAVGGFYRQHQLQIHTPSKTFNFRSKQANLQDVAQAIRGGRPE